MRRLALLLAVLVAVGGAAAVVLGRDRSGPFPSEADARAHGFAVWPVDTVEEAEAECAEAQDWRLDLRETALRFVRELLRYPKPFVSEGFGEEEHRVRLLMSTRGLPGVTLGSVVELARFGRCWYVTGAMPREGDLGATLGFVHRDGRPHLLLGHTLGLPSGFVGFGDWETEIDPGLRQWVVWMPELPADATGHAIYTLPDEDGVSEVVGAESLAPVPPPPEEPADPLGAADVIDDPAVCRIESSPYKTPERVIKDLYESGFIALLRQVNGFPRYERKAFRRVGDDRWRLVVDDAVLIATIPEIAKRCYKLVSLVPAGRDAPLRRLWVDDAGVTFGIDWGGGDEVSLAFGSGFDGLGATLKQIGEPVTFPHEAAPQPSGVPTYARVVLYKDQRVVSAFYGLFGSD